MDWTQPRIVSDATHAFPANVIGVLLPPKNNIPKEFFDCNNKWTSLANDWFFCGIAKSRFIPKENIDLYTALKHLSACLRSYEPQHEHKEAGVGYLMSLWFDESTLNKNRQDGP